MTLARKPKLLLIGHTYCIEVNREKALHLAKYFEVKVCTIDLAGWKIFGTDAQDTSTTRHQVAYELRRLPYWPKWEKPTKIFLKGLEEEMAAFHPDMILLENEPWSLLRWQARFSSWMACPKAQFIEFTWENLRRRGLKGLLASFVYKAVARTTDGVICGNRAAKDLFLAAGLTSDRLPIDGQLGVNEEDFPLATAEEKQNWRIEQGWQADDFVVGFCGRLVEEKGLIELTAAVESLRYKFPKLRLALLGSGPLKASLKQMDPSGEWLQMLPALPHDEVHTFLNKLDVFVLPSKPLNQKGQLWEEQFGHVIIEAIASGVLTIGSNSGAIPEVLANENMIFPHSSKEAIVQILQRIFNEPSESLLLAKQQRLQCLSRWSHAELARRYADILQRNAR